MKDMITLEDISKDIKDLKQDLEGVKQDLAGVKQDLDGVKKDVVGQGNEFRALFSGLHMEMIDGFKSVRDEIKTEVRAGVDDVLEQLETFVDMTDTRFTGLESQTGSLKEDIRRFVNKAREVEARGDVSEDERLVMRLQLAKIKSWARQAGDHIGLKFEA